jgi:S-layer protein
MALTNTQTVKTTGVTYDSGANISQNWIEQSPAGINTFALQDNTLSSAIKVLGSNDVIYIEANFADYQFKQNGKTIAFSNGTEKVSVTMNSMTNKVQVTATLIFLDGSVTLSNQPKSTKVSITGLDDNEAVKSQKLTTKYADVTINAASNESAADYFSGLPINTTETFNLTTAVDIFTPTSNAIVNGILGTGATINSFDSVVASGTNNTFNIVDNATNFAMPASITLSGLQIVNLSRAAAATGNVTITNTTFGTAVTSLNLVDANTVTSGTVAITLNSATSVSAINTGTTGFSTGMVITDGGAGLLQTVTVQGAVGTLAINGNGITTVNLTTVGGLTTLTASAATRALTVNVAGATGNGLTDATATTVTINNTVTAAGGAGTYTTAAATTVNFNTTTANTATITAAIATTLNVGGSALATLTLTGSTALTAVNVSGTASLAANLTTVATAVTALNFTNTAGISTVTVNLATAVTGGAGIENITVGAGTAAINLGTGNDTLTLTGSALGTGGTANGGTAGTDVLSMGTANAATASATTALATAVTGFERLTLTTNAASTIDLAQLGGYNYVTIADGGLALQLNNMASGGTVVIGGANSGGLTMGGTLGSGVNDTLNLALNNSTASLVAFGTVAASNVENIAVVVSDTQGTATPLVNTLNTLTIDDASMRSLTVSGTDGLAITLATSATALQTFDASGITSGTATGNTTNVGVNFTSSALAFASTVKGTLLGGDVLDFSAALASVSITETAGTNTIKGSSTIGSTLIGGTGIDTIVGGAGVDTISVGASAVTITNSVNGAAAADSISLTGSVGADTLIYGANSTAAGAAGINMDTIANFATTIDKIQLQISAGTAVTSTLNLVGAAGTTVGAMATVINDAVSVATIADVYTQLATDLVAANFAASATGAGNLVAREVTFASGAAAGTYLVIDDGVAGFQAGNDVVIHLTGATTVVAGDFAYNYVA